MVDHAALRSPADLTGPVIVCSNLTKDYGSGHGVFDLDLSVEPAEVFGFIGPNGAGKSTTIRLLMDLIRADRGWATLLGLDSHRDALALKRSIGYLPGELPQFPGVRAGQVISLLANLRGGCDWRRIRELADRFELDLGRKYQELSHGNKQKVGLVQAFMHTPELLILDEPTIGLDPLMQREFRSLVKESAAAGATVLLSSHVLAEVQLACDRIGLIRTGRLLKVGTLEELRTVRTHRLEAILTGTIDVQALARLPGVTEARMDGDRVSCNVHGSVGPVLTMLAAADTVELDSTELSLEEVFLAEYSAAP